MKKLMIIVTDKPLFDLGYTKRVTDEYAAAHGSGGGGGSAF